MRFVSLKNKKIAVDCEGCTLSRTGQLCLVQVAWCVANLAEHHPVCTLLCVSMHLDLLQYVTYSVSYLDDKDSTSVRCESCKCTPLPIFHSAVDVNCSSSHVASLQL